jgi:hypothetical protein
MHWVHQQYWQPGPQGNDIHKTNVPNLRMRFRYDNLQACSYCLFPQCALALASAHRLLCIKVVHSNKVMCVNMDHSCHCGLQLHVSVMGHTLHAHVNRSCFVLKHDRRMYITKHGNCSFLNAEHQLVWNRRSRRSSAAAQRPLLLAPRQPPSARRRSELARAADAGRKCHK